MPFFSPGPAPESGCGRNVRYRSGRRHRDDHQRTGGQRTAHRVAVGSDTTGLVPMIQTALTSPRPMAANSSTAVSPGVCASRSVPRSGPAAADRLAQNPCAPPASSPARRLRGRPWRWVDRSAKGAAAAAAILPAGQMDVDDGVTFVAAAGGLIDSHGEGDRPRGR